MLTSETLGVYVCAYSVYEDCYMYSTVTVNHSTHFRQNKLSNSIYWKSQISTLGMSDNVILIFHEKPFAISGDPDHAAVATFDLGLYCTVYQLPFLGSPD